MSVSYSKYCIHMRGRHGPFLEDHMRNSLGGPGGRETCYFFFNTSWACAILMMVDGPERLQGAGDPLDPSGWGASHADDMGWEARAGLGCWMLPPRTAW